MLAQIICLRETVRCLSHHSGQDQTTVDSITTGVDYGMENDP